MSIEETEKEIAEEFELFGDDWEGKYEHIIDLGRSLPLIDPQLKTEDRIIKGCQSKVWLGSELRDGKVYFTADSDAIITKGLAALMVRVLSGHAPEEVMNAKLDFLDRIGLKDHLSPTRSNGLLAMIRQMKLDALALQSKKQ